MATTITTVREVSAHASLIIRVFRTALRRPPELAALQGFSAMLSKGEGAGELARAVVGSAEFRTLHGQEERCDEAYITRLFRNGLGRDPDPGALTTLLNGSSRAELLAKVADSREARERIDLLADLFPDGPLPSDPLAYTLWVQRHGLLDEQDLLAINRQIASLPETPRISLLIAAEPTRPDLLLETVEALDEQLYPYWDLYVACPCDLPTAVRSMLQTTASHVPGIVLVEAPSDGGIGDLWQAALTRAEASFVAFLEAGDRLAATALYEIALALDKAPHLDLLYSDEDTLDEAGERCAPLFKPGWSPDMLLAGDTVGQLAIFRRSRVLAVGGIREDGGSHARYDLLLRVTQGLHAGAIAHIPSVLYHRGRKPGRPLPFPRSRNTSIYPDVARTVKRHLEETSGAIIVSDVYIGGDVWPKVTFPLPASLPRVSILIPTREQPELLRACMTGLLERTTYPNIEILIADNGSTSAAAQLSLRRLSRDPRVQVDTINVPFNWSVLNNRLAARATGSIFVLMNDDTDVIGSDWLDEMVRQVTRPGVGIAGARLLYRDRSLQHGGITVDEMGATHVLRSAREEDPGYLGQLVLTRDLLAVTGACLAVRRDTFEAIGGADESFSLTCNDIDMCLRARAAGHRVVWTPHALLTHVDGVSRGPDDSFARLSRSWHDLRRLHDRWHETMDADPFLNANLVATDHHLLLATPPRRERPWQKVKDEAVRAG